MVQLMCEWCGISFRREKRQKFCGKSCSAKWRMSRPDFVKRLQTPRRIEACRQAMLRLRRNPEAMGKLRDYLLSDRNPFRNPVTRPQVQQKANQSLAASGFAMLNGGNGTGPTKPQLLLATLLGWPMEHVVPTGGLPGYPSHYKLDLANPGQKIAIEVDGLSHGSKRVQAKDIKKMRFLEARGWTVLRFKNAEVLQNLPAVISKIGQVSPFSISKQRPATISPTASWSTTVTA
jgi:hypothetical protein